MTSPTKTGHGVGNFGKPAEETYKATFGLMCAGLAIDMGWTMEEAIELVRLGFEVKRPTTPRVAP
jgi:hypothetical protein